MNDYTIRQAVRFLPGALVTERAAVIGRGIVEGYDEVDGSDFVIVSVKAPGAKPFEQWVLPNEIEPVTEGTLQ